MYLYILIVLANVGIAIPVFLFLRWLLAKTELGKKTRNILEISGSVVLAPAIFIGSIYGFLYALHYHPNKDFDRQAWAKDPWQRYEMSQDIIESRLLIGKPKREVELLLGDECDIYIDRCSYMLGFEPGIFSMDPTNLVITFENGKVVKVHESFS